MSLQFPVDERIPLTVFPRRIASKRASMIEEGPIGGIQSKISGSKIATPE
jgi:hypothetical protein